MVPIERVPTRVGPDGAVAIGRDEYVGWLGPEGHVICYPIRRGELYNIFAGHVSAAWVEESWSVPSSIDELLAGFAGWNEALLEMLGHTTQCFKWGIRDRDPLDRWTRGPIALLGDAAHPMMPTLAQGAAITLEALSLGAGGLDLEITEGAVMETFVQTNIALNAFREHGMRVALDDFGTGYSSLGYLTQIPIDVIKIDRRFVSRLPEDRGSSSIVRAILALAGALGVEATAEGVETAVQALALEAMVCRRVQGFYFSRPVTADQIPALARRDWRLSAAPALTASA